MAKCHKEGALYILVISNESVLRSGEIVAILSLVQESGLFSFSLYARKKH